MAGFMTHSIQYYGANESFGACYRVVFSDGHEYEYHTPFCIRAGGRHEGEPK